MEHGNININNSGNNNGNVNKRGSLIRNSTAIDSLQSLSEYDQDNVCI